MSKKIYKDEQHSKNEKAEKSYRLELTMAFIQIIMFICLFKQNLAWRGFLAVQLFACGCLLCKKYSLNKAKPYLYSEISFIIFSILTVSWFIIGI